MSTQLENEFTVPVPVERAWPVLLDVERIAPCMPGAALDSVDGDEFTGRIKVKVGPITVTYKGEARFTEKDEDKRVVVIDASGKEARGAGTASATVKAVLVGEGDSTRVRVDTTLNVTGRVAQFGRGVMADVSAKLIDRFAANLADLLSEDQGGGPEAAGGSAAAEGTAGGSAATGSAPASGGAAATSTGAATGGTTGTGTTGAAVSKPAPASRDDEALDLLDVAGMPMLKRFAPVLGVAFAVVLFFRRRARKRKKRAA
ncbi:MAG: carbon monoxide dehydrogenase [Streptosporangiales bacterium]|nr:carbon monoxide dehydrogenase [Streptosporangiales bacterium]